MRAHPVLLQKKYARIIALLAERLSITTMRALDLFYHSDTYALMREGVADMHCRSDLYLVDEIVDELQGVRTIE
ncbi:DUF3791 domain-containing protein [Veillonella sp. CHU732]|uniref:DUF3791 domain-containing protein n=1 Tax=Veillonella sp. CHU732 TaxID=2490949 RepID=UPI000F8F32E1|nr:DUF3791 domain-containing protein [Veillonella sp. CHU732]